MRHSVDRGASFADRVVVVFDVFVWYPKGDAWIGVTREHEREREGEGERASHAGLSYGPGLRYFKNYPTL